MIFADILIVCLYGRFESGAFYDILAKMKHLFTFFSLFIHEMNWSLLNLPVYVCLSFPSTVTCFFISGLPFVASVNRDPSGLYYTGPCKHIVCFQVCWCCWRWSTLNHFNACNGRTTAASMVAHKCIFSLRSHQLHAAHTPNHLLDKKDMKYDVSLMQNILSRRAESMFSPSPRASCTLCC